MKRITEYDTNVHIAVKFDNGYYGFISKRDGLIESGGMSFEQFQAHHKIRLSLDSRCLINYDESLIGEIEEAVKPTPDFDKITFPKGASVTVTERKYIKQGLKLTGGVIGSEWKSKKMKFQLIELTETTGKIKVWKWESGWNGSEFVSRITEFQLK